MQFSVSTLNVAWIDLDVKKVAARVIRFGFGTNTNCRVESVECVWRWAEIAASQPPIPLLSVASAAVRWKRLLCWIDSRRSHHLNRLCVCVCVNSIICDFQAAPANCKNKIDATKVSLSLSLGGKSFWVVDWN
jgi:hypothetical protein